MKKFLVLLAVSLSACSMIPSRWDANQSRSATDIQQVARHLDCNNSILPQAVLLKNQIEWFDLYAASKGTADMAKLTKIMDDTTQELIDRAKQGPVSPMYCDLKKKVLNQQADIIANAVQGRF